MFKYGGLALLPALVLLTGCPRPCRPGIAPQTAQQALDRVNNNLSQIQAPVQYKGFASFRFRDAKGKDRRFLGQDASLIFAQPHSLRFDIRSLAGTIAQFGSNDERFWLWVEPETNKLWWGRWASLGSGSSQLPLPADDLIDALMLRPLPTTQADGNPPDLREAEGAYYLVYQRPSSTREIKLDPAPPYQPIEIIDRTPDNQIQMRAILDKYSRIDDKGPYTPRKYVIYWPLDEAEMRLDATRVALRPDLPPETFAFPESWAGEVEELDAQQQ
ncbi:MAG: hypothetical protein KBH81_03600 [Phycisphaerae bacterium]|nr:hypothetical protein [Phycisphaerae bacterium]